MSGPSLDGHVICCHTRWARDQGVWLHDAGIVKVMLCLGNCVEQGQPSGQRAGALYDVASHAAR